MGDVCRYQGNVTRDVLDTIVSVQPKESGAGGAGETRESSVARQTRQMLEKIPQPYDPSEIKQRWVF